MIPHKEARELLKIYAKLTHMTDSDVLRLFTLLETNCVSVFGLVCWLENHYGSRFDAPEKVLYLISALSCNSPVCAIIHPDNQLETVLEEVAAKETTLSKDPNKMLVVQTKCPILFHAIIALNTEELPNSWCNLIRAMMQVALRPFAESEGQSSSGVVESSSVAARDPSGEIEQHTNYAFFPNLPIKRQRISFPFDRRKETERNCTKVSHGHPSLLPGIFTILSSW